MESRQALHALVDELPEPELPAAKRFLEYLREQPEDPLRAALNGAAVDNEPITESDAAAIREGLEDLANGETVSHEEVKRLLQAK